MIKVTCPICGHEIFNCGHNERRGCIECECELDQNQALKLLLSNARLAALRDAARAMCVACSSERETVKNETGGWIHVYPGERTGFCCAGAIHDLIAREQAVKEADNAQD